MLSAMSGLAVTTAFGAPNPLERPLWHHRCQQRLQRGDGRTIGSNLAVASPWNAPAGIFCRCDGSKGLDLFTEVYEKTRDLLQTPQLHADWADIEAALKGLVQPGGPSVSKAAALDNLQAPA